MVKKRKSSGMYPKTYRILERSVEEGINLGWNRAHKHEDAPSAETLKAVMLANVMVVINEWFDFEEDEK